MTALLILALAAIAIAVVVAFVRGLGAFYRDAERIRAGDRDAGAKLGQMQNRMMAQRVFFQGLAIIVVVLLGSIAAG